MEEVTKTLKDYMYPPEKTFTDHCIEYMREHPSTVATGAGVVLVGWYTIPIVLTTVAWVPYLGASYYVYTQTRNVQETVSWYQWAQGWFSNN